jgi:hypothetical protein
MQNNRIEREEDIRKEQRGLMLHCFAKIVSSSVNKLARCQICKSTNDMQLAKHWILIKIQRGP